MASAVVTVINGFRTCSSIFIVKYKFTHIDKVKIKMTQARNNN